MQWLFNGDAAAALLRQNDREHAGSPFGADGVAVDRLHEIEGMFNHPGASGEADDEAQIADFDFHGVRFGPGGRDSHRVMRPAIVDQRTFERRPAAIAPASDQQVFEKLIDCAGEIAEPDRTAAFGCS